MSSWRFPIISRSYQSTLLVSLDLIALLVSIGHFKDLALEGFENWGVDLPMVEIDDSRWSEHLPMV